MSTLYKSGSSNQCRQHVLDDLRPYICTFDSCNVDPFKTKRAWFEHELNQHRVVWHCPCCEQTHETLDNVKTHLRVNHEQFYRKPGLSDLLRQYRHQKTSFRNEDCPFCDGPWTILISSNPRSHAVVSRPVFRDHLATHLEQVALSALIPLNGPGDQNMVDEEYWRGLQPASGSVDHLDYWGSDEWNFSWEFLKKGATDTALSYAAVDDPSGLLHGSASSRASIPYRNTFSERTVSTQSSYSRIGTDCLPPIHSSLSSPLQPSAESLGWVSLQMDAQSGRMAAAHPYDQERLPKGRKKALDPKQRSEAALMRIIGSCSNCKKRKEKCDPGTPCKACLKHYKGDLVNHPCRVSPLRNLISEQSPFRQLAEPPLAVHDLVVDGVNRYKIPIFFAFGPPIALEVHLLTDSSIIGDQDRLDSDGDILMGSPFSDAIVMDAALSKRFALPQGLGYIGSGDSSSEHTRVNMRILTHRHFIYQWPPPSDHAETPNVREGPVLPVVLTTAVMDQMEELLHEHLSDLVMKDFAAFPVYVSPLRVLRSVYIYFRAMGPNTEPFNYLREALKLLVLVHCHDDITIPKAAEVSEIAHIAYNILNPPLTTEFSRPAICFVRAQIREKTPQLAEELTVRVFSYLERLFQGGSEEDWPTVLALMLVMMMVLETVQYHTSKRPYHHESDSNTSHMEHNDTSGESASKTLLSFYAMSFSACHTRLDLTKNLEPIAEGDERLPSSSKFVHHVRKAMQQAEATRYLSAKISQQRTDGDMSFFFDRLVAKLLLLDTS